MTVPEGVLAAAIRGLAVALLLAYVAPAAARAATRQPWHWGLLLLPLFTPSLLVGTCYSGLLHGAAGEPCYVLLLATRLLPIAALLAAWLPGPPIDRRAHHCARMMGGPRGTGLALRGPVRNRAVVGAVTFCLAFAEFELASLGARPTWTVWLFDAQTGGLPLAETLRAAVVPVLIETGVLGSAVVWLVVSGAGPAEPAGDPPWHAALWSWIAVAVAVLLPGATLARGLSDLRGQLQFGTELGHGALLAGAAAASASGMAVLLPRRVLAWLSLPGLLGGLVLGLGIQSLFQLPGLQTAYDTPLPLLVGWTLLLLPIGALLLGVTARMVPAAAVHQCALLAAAKDATPRRAAGRIHFALSGIRHAGAVGVLFATAFFEVVAADLLAPASMTPAAPRLYNLLHYGQSAGLAAMVLWMCGTAVAACTVLTAGWRALARPPALRIGGPLSRSSAAP
ncbi:MAG: hypothetical protein H6837_20785 [Planctomycetes bacterium]|nr:hypothetical protein [Planctomycetota bacterium]